MLVRKPPRSAWVDSGIQLSLGNVGSVAVCTNRGSIVHPGVNEREVQILEDVLKVEVDIGTANFGAPYLNSCMIANSNGAIVGKNSSGTELIRIEQTLDLIR